MHFARNDAIVRGALGPDHPARFLTNCAQHSESSQKTCATHCADFAAVVNLFNLHVSKFARVTPRTAPLSARRHRMPARETEAIILKTFPLGEADRLVSFLGRSSGRLRGVAAGARSVKNRYGSTLQIMSHVQLWYVEKETRELVRIQQCELLESLNKSQSDYGLSTGLAAVSEITELVLPDHEVSEAMFRLILLTAREIERRGSWPLPLSYFVFWTVRLAGWLPRFDVCATCGKPFGNHAYQAEWLPGLLCEEHRRSGMKPVSFAARELVKEFTRTSLDKLEVGPELDQPVTELREAGFSWIEHHAERKLRTREMLETT
jgi:DNA repair protein RecO (recombination protein O)